MRTMIAMAAGISALAWVGSMANAATTTAPTLQTDQQKVSYAMGYETGKAFSKHQVTVDPKSFVEGLRAGVGGHKPAMTEDEIKQTLATFQQQVAKKMQAEQAQTAEKNLKAGEDFLTKNKSETGVVTTDSGLQYKVIKEGSGPKPAATDTVTVEYTGKLLDGKVFDSTKKHGQPATFPVNGVIKGWQEALQLMPVGSTWELFIPADLAYGKRGAGQLIGPNETLVFTVHLLSINGKDADKSNS